MFAAGPEGRVDAKLAVQIVGHLEPVTHIGRRIIDDLLSEQRPDGAPWLAFEMQRRGEPGPVAEREVETRQHPLTVTSRSHQQVTEGFPGRAARWRLCVRQWPTPASEQIQIESFPARGVLAPLQSTITYRSKRLIAPSRPA